MIISQVKHKMRNNNKELREWDLNPIIFTDK